MKNSESHPILVTGASSGIGHHLTHYLAERGHLVYATARKGDEIFEIFDVNVFGPLRMTNAFVRMLIQSKGRIVNIGSQGGMITSKYFGPYTMTKYALEAYTEALHQELKSYGVHVSIVQPGGILTEDGANAMPGTLARFQRAESPLTKKRTRYWLLSISHLNSTKMLPSRKQIASHPHPKLFRLQFMMCYSQRNPKCAIWWAQNGRAIGS